MLNPVPRSYSTCCYRVQGMQRKSGQTPRAPVACDYTSSAKLKQQGRRKEMHHKQMIHTAGDSKAKNPFTVRCQKTWHVSTMSAAQAYLYIHLLQQQGLAPGMTIQSTSKTLNQQEITQPRRVTQGPCWYFQEPCTWIAHSCYRAKPVVPPNDTSFQAKAVYSAASEHGMISFSWRTSAGCRWCQEAGIPNSFVQESDCFPVLHINNSHTQNLINIVIRSWSPEWG